MFIEPDSTIYQRIKADTQKVINVSGGPEALRSMYRNHTQTRFVWDMFRAGPGYAENTCDLYALDYDDDQVETLLIQICKELGLIQTNNDLHHEQEALKCHSCNHS